VLMQHGHPQEVELRQHDQRRGESPAEPRIRGTTHRS
jgi:hypothetical protein